MEINRDIMRKVNKIAHLLAHKDYAKHRDVLATECKAMLANGKNRTDIDAYLADVEAGQTKLSNTQPKSTSGL